MTKLADARIEGALIEVADTVKPDSSISDHITAEECAALAVAAAIADAPNRRDIWFGRDPIERINPHAIVIVYAMVRLSKRTDIPHDEILAAMGQLGHELQRILHK